MYTRWRNLAAAAGAALCFPIALAQAAPHRDDSHNNPPSICTELHDSRRTAGCFGCEGEHWYERYYQNPRDEFGSRCDESGMPNMDSSLSGDTTGRDDDGFTADMGFEELEDNQGDEVSTLIDSEGRCSDPTCPCNDTIDLEDKSDSSEPPITNAVYPPNSLDVSIHYLDVYEPFRNDVMDEYDHPTAQAAATLVPRLIELNEPITNSHRQIDPTGQQNDETDDSFESVPSALFTGTIELEVDEFDGETIDGLLLDDQEVTLDLSITVVEETHSEGDHANAADELDQRPEEEPSDETPKYHMFYPGCDWTPYYPTEPAPNTESVGEPSTNEFLGCYQSAGVAGNYPFRGAGWVWQGAFFVVTWTGKFAEQFTTFVNQTGACFTSQGTASNPFAD